MSVTMVDRRRKISKLHWLKRPKKSRKKRNLDPKINSSKLHIWSLSFSSRFSSILEFNKNWRKRSLILQYSFTQKKPFTHFPNFDSLSIAKMILPQQKLKTLLYKFSSKHDSDLCQKKYLLCTFLDVQELDSQKHLEMKCLYILVNLVKKTFVPEA